VHILRILLNVTVTLVMQKNVIFCIGQLTIRLNLWDLVCKNFEFAIRVSKLRD